MNDDLNQRLASAMTRTFGRAPAGIVRAPGRVNLIGEHTDYNDGFVLPCAIGGETRIAWAPRDDGQIAVIATDFDDQTDSFALDGPIGHHPDGGWRNYVRAMASACTGHFEHLQGVSMAIAGTLPRGAGLSSSASLEIAVGHALLARAGRPADPTRLALLAQTAENDFIGVRCGIMDQLACAASVAQHALMIDCRSLVTRPVPIPAGIAIAIIHSGVVRGLVDGQYNQRRAECEAAAHAMGVPALRDADLALLDATDMPEIVRARARHVIGENARVLAMADSLARGDLARSGALMAQSDASMRDDFTITVPAIDQLVEIAQDAIGGQGGARMTGGGFGGAVVALLRTDAVPAFTETVRQHYRTPDGQSPTIMIEQAADGAGRIAWPR